MSGTTSSPRSPSRTKEHPKRPSRLQRLLCCTSASSPILSPSASSPHPAQSLTQGISEASSSVTQRVPRAPVVRPHFIPFECPWLPTKTPYDNHPDGFWDFPERAGWALDGQRKHRTFPNEVANALNPVMTELDQRYKCRQRTISTPVVKKRPNDSLSVKCFRSNGDEATMSEEVAFLQAWLFVGVLAQVNMATGVEADFASLFCVPAIGDDTKILSTAPLNALPHRWLEALETLSEAHRIERWKELLKIAQHVMTLQTSISTQKSDAEEPRTLTYDECKVLLSIRVLFRAIVLTLALSGSSPPSSTADLELLMHPALSQSFPASWDELKDFAIDDMLAAGWCKSECQLLERYDGAFNFFASRLSAGRWRMDHGRCTDWMCVADQVDEKTYTTAHVERVCKCAMVHVEAEDLCTVLDHGKVPRIVISKDWKLSVVNDGQPYVAISHVWAHGLGNPVENALPRCQVQRLAAYIADLQSAGQPVSAVWMDTLCVPVQDALKPYRKKAITMMSQTYKDAYAVLVLDRELQGLDTEKVSVLEQELLTAFVGWTRRLWTLQEASLANRLYVQTLRSAHKLDNADRKDARELLLARICFCEDMHALMRSRIPPMATLKQSVFEVSSPIDTNVPIPISTCTTPLQRLALAVQHRVTSKMEDEPLILAITLGLDPTAILDTADPEVQMSVLMTLLRDVPADIVFGAWPKLARAPFRWAPRSLLGFPLHALQSFGPGAVCDSRGLHACYEGTILCS
ncbi:hypothetical protein C8Q73DRAFT_697870 [Cubamyces lactineus]|nr:hypothetical protein C8Q73DRAFT_697870 [Cubamyces lactineus]